MKYISTDIETTGLNCESDQMLSFAAIFVNHEGPGIVVDNCPYFQCFLKHERIWGSPVAIAMNAELIRFINGEDYQNPAWDDSGRLLSDTRPKYEHRKMFGVLDDGTFWMWFGRWLGEFYGVNDRIVVAGKNPNFDKSFMMKLPGATERRFHHRVLDPGMYYTNLWEDAAPASTEDCIRRAKLPTGVLHNELEDAKRVIQLLDHGFNHHILPTWPK